MSSHRLVLYIGKGCKFCDRVLDYLKQNPTEIEIKDVWGDDEAFEELKALADRTQVPCLKIDDSFMHESLDIIAKLKTLS